jgi:membrane protease YdiL (CAAX protease family)
MDDATPIAQVDAPAPENSGKLIAPIWHTVLLVVVVLLVSFGGSKAAHREYSGSKLPLYTWNILWQLLVVGYVWVGLRLRKTRLRDVVGGKWNTVEAFFLDVAIAAGFWFGSMIVLAGLRYVMGILPKAQDLSEVKRTLGFLLPQTTDELLLWMVVTLTAGICEEIIFRGYLQQQSRLITDSAWLGIVVSGIVFGAGHGYQGLRMMIVIAVYGMMFGLLAHFRRSLRPGMMAHAWQDALTGIVSRIALK